MEPGRIKAGEVLSESIFAMIREGQLFLLLIAFVSILSMLLMWPVMDWYIILFENFPENTPAAFNRIEAMIERDSAYLKIMVWPSLLFSIGAMVLWTRAIANGASGAFGSPGRFLRRIVWVFWRYICAAFILFAALFVIMIPFFFIRPGTGEGFIFAIILYPLFFIFALGVTILLSVSLHAEARDLHLPIHKGLYFMKGNLLRASGALVLVMLAVATIQWFIWFLALGLITGDNVFLKYTGFFVVFAFSSVVNFFWVGFGAGYAMRLVPGMR